MRRVLSLSKKWTVTAPTLTGSSDGPHMITSNAPLALVTLVSIPLSMLIVPLIMRRSQRRFADMWKSTGELNSEIEEAYTGHSLVKVFGRKSEVEATFRTRNEALFKSSFGAQFLSGILMPSCSTPTRCRRNRAAA